MDGQHNPPKSELKFLERLSIEELEALLKFSGDPDDVELLFDTVVEEVVARETKNPTGRLPDVDTAWDEFQMTYNSLDRETLPTFSEEEEVLPNLSHGSETPATQAKDKPKSVSFRRVIRTAAAMAAAIALCLGLMVGAQAAGADVFGTLARWTDETFHFETRSAELDNSNTLYISIQESLNMQESFDQYTPRWYPEGSIITDMQTFKDDMGRSVQISLRDGSGKQFFICIDQYNQNNYVDPLTFEIEAGSVEEYLSNGKTYFIFANSKMTTAVFNNSTTVYRIWGELVVQEVKCMLDSIGG